MLTPSAPISKTRSPTGNVRSKKPRLNLILTNLGHFLILPLDCRPPRRTSAPPNAPLAGLRKKPRAFPSARRERPTSCRAAEQRDELAASCVEHGLLLALWRRPIRSVYHTPSLPRTGRQAMGQT